MPPHTARLARETQYGSPIGGLVLLPYVPHVVFCRLKSRSLQISLQISGVIWTHFAEALERERDRDVCSGAIAEVGSIRDDCVC